MQRHKYVRLCLLRNGVASTWTTHSTSSERQAAQRQRGASTSLRRGTSKSATTLYRERYRQFLAQSAGGAFTDGTTSHDYRRARFEATLDHFALDHAMVDELLGVYERVLIENLQLKPGVVSLSRVIKASGRKIAVITEGPQDAQERAVRDLGIVEYIDFLATTNYFGVTKISDLFQKVLDHLGIQASEMVYVGDSLDRDVIPATAQGIIRYPLRRREARRFTKINSLKNLDDLLLIVPSTDVNALST